MSESERASARRTETIPEWKREEVADLEAFLDRYESVGIVDVAGIPSRQLQSMRRDLHGSAELRMSRNTLVCRALESVDEGLEDLVGFVSGQVGLIGTNDNPFALYQKLEASKTPAPINAGEIAPNDIVIPEGDTGVDPGPFVGELQTVGAEARIMEGSIQVTADSVVCEAGEEVSADLADVLGELGIEPKEVGLDLRAVQSEGVLFEPDELAIDVDAYRADVEAGAAAARNLSINAAYPTARTVGSLLGTAAGEAKAVGLYAAIEDPDVLPDLVARADAQVRALAGAIDDEEALPEELRGVAAPAADAGDESATDEEDEADEEDQADDQTSGSEAEEAGDDDDDDAGAEGLGEMFG
jgi:large subunit ribosomal protein L10